MMKNYERVRQLKNSFLWTMAFFAFVTVMSCVWTSSHDSSSSSIQSTEPMSSEMAEFHKHLPMDVYDVRMAAWRTTLEKDGKITMHFNQGSFVKGWGDWQLANGKLIVNRTFQEQFEPETGEPVESEPVTQKTIYDVIYNSDHQLLLDNQAKGADGMWSVGNS